MLVCFINSIRRHRIHTLLNRGTNEPSAWSVPGPQGRCWWYVLTIILVDTGSQHYLTVKPLNLLHCQVPGRQSGNVGTYAFYQCDHKAATGSPHYLVGKLLDLERFRLSMIGSQAPSVMISPQIGTFLSLFSLERVDAISASVVRSVIWNSCDQYEVRKQSVTTCSISSGTRGVI